MADLLAPFERLQDWRNLVDIALVGITIYAVLRLLRDTQAAQVLRGLVVIALAVAAVNQVVEFTAFNWLLSTATPFLFFAIPVIFQPELRRALERVGRTTPLLRRRTDDTAVQRVVNEVVKAVETLVRRRQGALIVFEGVTGVGEITSLGVQLNAEVSADLLTTIFFPNTALHDGATVIRGDRIVASSCVLPLSQREAPEAHMGTRHRAALGLSEQGDSLVVVVSEETGTISVARNGRMIRVDSHRLRVLLSEFYRS
jgi:diadenylate cyclase